jgi:hypothetical protein
MKRNLLIMFFIGMVSLFACSKSDPAPTKEQLLTISKGWVRSDYTVTTKTGVLKEKFSDITPCVQDDVFKFTTDGKGKSTEGATSCSPPSADTSFTWAFNTDKTKITIGFTGGSEVYDVKELSATSLKISFVLVTTDLADPSNGNVTVITFSPVK